MKYIITTNQRLLDIGAIQEQIDTHGRKNVAESSVCIIDNVLMNKFAWNPHIDTTGVQSNLTHTDAKTEMDKVEWKGTLV